LYPNSSPAVCAATLGFAKIVFLTTGTYLGNLTTATQTMHGVAGGDADCQAEANAVGLPGTYKAWLSDSLGHSPSTTFNHSSVPYVMPDANLTKVADNWSQLAASATTPLSHPIASFANGSSAPLYVPVWTGTNADGTPNTSHTCINWTSTSHGDNAQAGVNAYTNHEWTDYLGAFSGYMDCGYSSGNMDQAPHLYCFQQ
jgi:hypothetical protein